MELLFLISLGLFALSALVWFAVWAIWIHANKAAYGPAPSGYAAAVLAEPMDPALRRRLAWYGRLKHVTLVLLGITVVLGIVVLSGRAR